ncbi:putative mitochondrial protein [Cucumis melo var. makuwa]|uniref:Putative mitochondrial protein n=1 Tax=Cucumis melo var. makuwa TaxID=1194695 RepID=A0A5D3BSK9_CUCMM|nr:putative mitochondrial protein [Cucumis melo var. makuwa]
MCGRSFKNSKFGALDLKQRGRSQQGESESYGAMASTQGCTELGIFGLCETLWLWVRSSAVPEFKTMLGGDSKFLRTYKRLIEELHWMGMKSDVKKYVEQCEICQRNKSESLSPAELLQPLPLPELILEDWTMDFIGQPKSGGYDAIMLARWSKCVPWAELWYNTTFHASLKTTPFQVVYSRPPPPLISSGTRRTTNDTAEQLLMDRDMTINSLKENLVLAQNWMKKQLLPKFYGPYGIIQKIGEVVYRLDLPPEALIHTVFHVSQLKRKLGQNQCSALPSSINRRVELQLRLETVLE